MVAIRSTLSVAALAAVVQAAGNPIIASIANDVVEGIAAAKTDDSLSDADATSEIQAVVDIVTNNPDVGALFTAAVPVIAIGLDETNFPSLLDAASKTLDVFEGSDDYKKAVEGFNAAFEHYDVPQALSNIISNIGAVLAIVTPSLPSLTPEFSDKWETATSRVLELATSLGILGGGKPKVAEATSAAAEATSAAAEATSAAAAPSSSAAAAKESSAAPAKESSAAPAKESAAPAKESAAPAKESAAPKESAKASAAPAAASKAPQQANGASAFNVQLAAGVAIVGAVAALI
ncbi:hypothetical protein B0I72DRAFT_162078 [Yarrowia lipolytica]|jgi:chemotaxis protein histidine kinase CheA|uniref:Uncharacterized protein n=1 Tax=Yarrowia lipolytica TaxID=4952 RepID=A0A371CEQ6_YARLL|nr:Hypothetical protein YALI2_F00835g [Yarrowia lipolytica]RDW28560.1 hypothetical protein B0I71DRAFT_171054 [Yarrowia lipolytica]RDW34921.1 hypothetical protein B0I72DRAFT_162078 [Yarrowia lipolytica]RDW48613.1 hypothetical protein B0I74DRAFT_106956 [Yarrowia lipolytica]RDW55248.1 hypothetical protein B0I75DRAFT_161964 [Yarrowia lipolytica]